MGGTNELPTWAVYRKRTGKCETCDSAMDTHPVCFRCHVLLGNGHLSPINHNKDMKPWCGHCH